MHTTLLTPIFLINISLAVTPHEYLTALLIHVCFNSGVSIPLNLIFLPLRWIVSPSTTLSSCDLTSLEFKKNISEGKDQYKRTLAECFVNDKSLSSYLVKSGYAFAYRKYSKKFIKDEDYARINRLGMWSMKFEYPWDFRRNN